MDLEEKFIIKAYTMSECSRITVNMAKASSFRLMEKLRKESLRMVNSLARNED